MKTKLDYTFWGLMLILTGGLALALQQGWLGQITPLHWIVAFGALGFIFFVRYLLAGVRYWGRLFPTSIFLATAIMIWLWASGYRDAWVVAPFFVAIAIPFVVATGVNYRKNWWAFIPALVSIIYGVVIVSKNGLSLDILGEISLAMFMFIIAIPFVLAYLVDHKKWWALIPAFVMFVSGMLTILAGFGNRWLGVVFLLVVSAPFFYISYKTPQNWWAIIPAGIVGSIGITALLSEPVLGRFARSAFPAAILFLGWAATFGWLWFQRDKYPTTWARIPTVIAGIVAIVLLAVASVTTFGLMVLFIAGGLLLIYRGLKTRKEEQMINRTLE